MESRGCSRGKEPPRNGGDKIVHIHEGGTIDAFRLEGCQEVVPTIAFRLHPNQPNPFNPRTTIRFDLPAAGPVRLAVYDVAGRLVAGGKVEGVRLSLVR